MIVAYICYGSAHSSIVAASIHVGLLPSDRIPTFDEILSMPHYDLTDGNQIGIPFYMGIDEYDNDVYAIGAKSGRKIMMKAVRSFLKESGIGENEIMLIDTLPAIGLLTKVGGMTSRRFKIISVGRPFTVYGIIKKYNNFLDIVNKVKSSLKELD
ncbi:DUF3189 family protein [Thermoanaerobacterium thermosaccharolyticum]|mgnify:CR=1 FL=1|jgi:hypothetical protein|uniref:DUF3189 domain-containing protein n=3 Tax=Thermoanaerobacterium thermosaccharolyticum TaxID=1517 RepID=D9TQK7_THETC|nr:DUF3189 family protein [Thermoanaerobacterium thermosaccharolyticum]ADL69241.1 conserved hypothetical protein [Thermoanaerobacterium thermosaccharolyticum DSM 571]AGB19371.1 Protein of unknown function (DUF3189) [Thermoanaerobacterium thermosaccharolyticum M0795]AST58747.1 hypothetical protein Thert_02947 [Thermoanaerobacterium thermosaccharolyticum]KAA5807238.1 DUF3189 family protein [Thermoanaerobacterium thermosaccharolyticum]MBE0069037.1 DUF3189 family protein [Thermoanaerobacterium the